MKKLEVSKILVLMGISIGLVACGQVNTEKSHTGNQGLSSLNGTIPQDEGGSGYAEGDEGGSGRVKPSQKEEFTPVGKDEGGSGLIEQDNLEDAAPVGKDEGGSGIKPPVGEGGSGYAELTDDIFYVKGSVDKEIKSIGLIINGKEQYTVDVRDGLFEFKVELAKEDLESMSVHLVIGKEVKTFMVLKGELQEVKY